MSRTATFKNHIVNEPCSGVTLRGESWVQLDKDSFQAYLCIRVIGHGKESCLTSLHIYLISILSIGFAKLFKKLLSKLFFSDRSKNIRCFERNFLNLIDHALWLK